LHFLLCSSLFFVGVVEDFVTMPTIKEDQNKESATEELRQPNADNIRIVSPIEDHHLPQVCQVLHDSFSTKRCIFLFNINESLSEVKRRYAKMSAAKRALGAVAVDDKGTVLGYVQMATSGMPTYPMNLHHCKKGEMYIEILGVSSEARGKGIGTKLLDWCFQTAISDESMNMLTLEVLRGNRAIGLYERFGLEIQPVDDCDECCGAVIICCLMGRPYGCCNREWGSVEMKMNIDRGVPAASTVER